MKPVLSLKLRLADLPQRKATQVRLVPDITQLEALADRFDLDGLRKMRFEGTLAPAGGRDWLFSGKLGATVVQACRVTTDPVTTRIDEAVVRRYTPDIDVPSENEEEVEMSEDDSIEPLPEVIEMGALMEEALSLAIPAFPRSEAADEIDLTAAPPGAQPLTDEAVKPFAGLAALKAKMEGKDEE
ncbi:DUF177 domain-containing protein [Jannaschia sp. 2305UL9-9]|uniref:YceD family protein n=1 Tax=Jannaschia sp. 2305UL9-9 TaxID=3121638 RepID=UPI003529643A